MSSRLFQVSRVSLSEIVSSKTHHPLQAGTSAAPTPFYPKMNNNTGNQGKSKKSSWKPILTFTAANALPVAGIAYYLKQSIEVRQAELEHISDLGTLPANDAADRIASVCKTASHFTLITNGGETITPILPHSPESTRLVLSSDEVVDNIDKSIPGTVELFDAIAASRDLSDSQPLRTIHFGISSSAPVGSNLLNKKKENRHAVVLYNGGPLSDITVSLGGSITIIEDERLRRFYWRDRWGSFVNRSDYILIKFVPSKASIASLNGGQSTTLVKDTNEWSRI